MQSGFIHSAFHIMPIGNLSRSKILFLHGFLGSGSDWIPVAEQLEPEYCSMLMDLPGHGETVISAEEDPETFFSVTVDAIADELNRKGYAPCYLAGYSMGGRIALALLLRYPELFEKAVIVSASPGLATAEERSERKSNDEGIARKIERNFDDFIEAWYDQPLFATLKIHPLFREIESRRKQSSPKALAASLRLLGSGCQPSFWHDLKENRVPVRFFVGEKDVKFVEIGRQMVNLCPYSALEYFPGCGHTLHFENRELFIDRMKEFFNTHKKQT
ncbi:MAG: 2-succinyl-6-hydroxy-2,4-cyclohexadiene-1-carboxylate synthase [Chlorobiaceae bacterium]|nr:2-succinyl-6-hydroxy-2,4-cyclohexadiene-1-carboxylate synthase [Chlorobiaceae bacterium]